jgi:pimeloyl-ACP methyl ester carboxylesterase
MGHDGERGKDTDITTLDGRTIRVRTAGPDQAPVIVYFHGTPDSRLTIDICGGLRTSSPVRLVAFDRPGYGGSTPAPFGLASVAADSATVLDALGIGRVAVLGQSGGGPFALACAGVLGDRVAAVGVASGPASFLSVPGGTDLLDESDRAALALVGIDDEAAARAFAAGFAPMAGLPDADDETIRAAMRGMMPTDGAALDIPGVADGLVAVMREGLRQGTDGCGWDNVAWVGPWRLDLDAVRAPTWLWYGADDPLAPTVHGEWLASQLPHAQLVVRPGEGHLGIYTHWDEMSATLTRTLA